MLANRITEAARLAFAAFAPTRRWEDLDTEPRAAWERAVTGLVESLDAVERTNTRLMKVERDVRAALPGGGMGEDLPIAVKALASDYAALGAMVDAHQQTEINIRALVGGEGHSLEAAVQLVCMARDKNHARAEDLQKRLTEADTLLGEASGHIAALKGLVTGLEAERREVLMALATGRRPDPVPEVDVQAEFSEVEQQLRAMDRRLSNIEDRLPPLPTKAG